MAKHKAPRDPATERQAAEVMALTEAWETILAGRPPVVQSAVIADLLATFLAGFQGADKELVREHALRKIINLARDLVPVNEARALARIKPKGKA